MWCLAWVEPFGWGEFWVAVVGDGDLPFVVVQESVVEAADEDAVVEAGFAAIDPMLEMMSVTPFGWPVAAGEGASFVSHDERSSQGARDEAAFAAEV